MKIVFLDPCNYTFYNNQASSPIGFAYLASYLEKHINIPIEFSVEVDVNSVFKHKPDIVGISSYTESYNRAISYAEQIKKTLDIPIIIGGIHISSLPESLNKCFDVGVIGDGEVTFFELIKSYVKNKSFLASELEKINGIVFYNGDEKIITSPREFIKNLDDLPYPKRSILHAYWPSIKKEWYWPQNLSTSRGCPYKCPFCVNSKRPSDIRFHSPERVVKEIIQILNISPKQKHITICDDLFTVNKKRLEQISNLIVSEKIHKKISFNCMCRADIFDDDIAYYLKRMNVKLITFGFESGEQETLNYLKGETSRVEDNQKAINLCEKYGINSGGYFIIGSPIETKESFAKTYWFIKNNFPPMCSIGTFCLTPFPNTKVWDYALEKGLVNPDTEDWNKYTYLESSIYKSAFMNEHYDFEFFEKAYKNYCLEITKKNEILNLYVNSDIYENSFKDVLNILRKYEIDKKDNILEIGSQFFNSIDELSIKNITKFDHWNYRKPKDENNKIENKLFDVIFFNYSLEQLINPYEKLEEIINNNLNEKGYLVILVRNTSFIENLVNLLIADINLFRKIGFKKLDDYFLINQFELIKNLEALGLKIISKLPIKVNINTYSELYNILIPLIANNIDIKEYIKDINTLSFLIIANKIDP